jgi:hypothetical protein
MVNKKQVPKKKVVKNKVKDEDWRKDYWCKPVTFEEFITSPEHLNRKPLSNRQVELIRQIWAKTWPVRSADTGQCQAPATMLRKNL